MTKKKAVKARKIIYPYSVKVLKFDGDKPADAFTFPCHNMKEAEKQVAFVKKIAGRNTKTGQHTYIIKNNK